MDPEEALERVTEPQVGDGLGVGLVGLGRSGATSLLAAMGRVAQGPGGHEGYELRLRLPCVALEAFAARRLSGDESGDPQAEGALLELDLRRAARGLFDRGGRWFLRLGAPRTGASVRALVVCVDIGDRRAAQRVEELFPVLEILGRRCSRVMFALTKVDRLVGWVPAEQSAERLALALDPVNQAEALLGAAGMRALLEPLRADTRVAFGLASAWGFCAGSGRPVVTSPEAFREWRPFGVADLALWIATGLERGLVRELGDRERSAWLGGRGWFAPRREVG